MHRFLVLVMSLACAGNSCAKPPPLTIEELRQIDFNAQLTEIRQLENQPGYDATIVSYESAGLKIHALIAVPLARQEKYPVIIANHGHHPDPPQYGITAAGVDHRPGDYYRSIPEMFTANGFIVVMPDYRGHNNSEGFEFTEGMLEASYYAEDVLNLLSAVPQIENADVNNIFMWGHSMGGEVTLRALVASEQVRGATLWSSVGGDIWDQSYYYSRYEDPHALDSSATEKYVVQRLRGRIDALDGPYDTRDNEPLLNLHALHTPIIIHHAIGDTGAAYKWSVHLAKELYVRDLPYEFHSYPGNEHLFSGESLRLAVERDVSYFRSLMN